MPVYAQDDFRLPAPGVMVHLSPTFDPTILKGIKVHPDNPFKFDFILDQGDGISGQPGDTLPTRGHVPLTEGKGYVSLARCQTN